MKEGKTGMSNEASVDEMYCRTCGEIIKREAEICPHCGVRNEGGPQQLSSQVESSGKAEGVSHDPSEYETTVSGDWYKVVALGIGLWLIYLLGVSVMNVPDNNEVIESVAFGAWLAMPIAGYYDMKHIRANSRWNPKTIPWVAGMILPGFSLIVGAIYLYRRHEVMGTP